MGLGRLLTASICVAIAHDIVDGTCLHDLPVSCRPPGISIDDGGFRWSLQR